MRTSSLTLTLSQQDVKNVVLESTSLLESLGFPFEKQVANHVRAQIASFQLVTELDKLKAVFTDCQGNCGWDLT